MKNMLAELDALYQTIKTLRSDHGCPWDRQQDAKSLRKYLRSEMDELLAAIEEEDPDNICEELGDLLFIVIMLSQIHTEKELFDFTTVVRDINAKLIRRHPHVFAGVPIENEEQLRQQWEAIKRQEKGKKSV